MQKTLNNFVFIINTFPFPGTFHTTYKEPYIVIHQTSHLSLPVLQFLLKYLYPQKKLCIGVIHNRLYLLYILQFFPIHPRLEKLHFLLTPHNHPLLQFQQLFHLKLYDMNLELYLLVYHYYFLQFHLASPVFLHCQFPAACTFCRSSKYQNYCCHQYKSHNICSFRTFLYFHNSFNPFFCCIPAKAAS